MQCLLVLSAHVLLCKHHPTHPRAAHLPQLTVPWVTNPQFLCPIPTSCLYIWQHGGPHMCEVTEDLPFCVCLITLSITSLKPIRGAGVSFHLFKGWIMFHSTQTTLSLAAFKILCFWQSDILLSCVSKVGSLWVYSELHWAVEFGEILRFVKARLSSNVVSFQPYFFKSFSWILSA